MSPPHGIFDPFQTGCNDESSSHHPPIISTPRYVFIVILGLSICVRPIHHTELISDTWQKDPTQRPLSDEWLSRLADIKREYKVQLHLQERVEDGCSLPGQ